MLKFFVPHIVGETVKAPVVFRSGKPRLPFALYLQGILQNSEYKLHDIQHYI
jgi:hypothetical protein